MTSGGPGRELRGIVIQVRDFGEAHRIVELLTLEVGRVALVARGARASRRRFAGCLDLFISLQVQARSGRDLWTLQAADVVDARLGLRRDLDRIARASTLCEWVRWLCPEHEPQPAIYAVLEAALDALGAGDVAGAASAYPRLLVAAGIMPPARELGTVDPAVTDVLQGGWCTDTAVARDIERHLAAYLEAHVGRRLRSRSLWPAGG